MSYPHDGSTDCPCILCDRDDSDDGSIISIPVWLVLLRWEDGDQLLLFPIGMVDSDLVH